MKFVFLSYLNRSGSTYLTNLFSKWENVCVCPEADILYELFLIHPNNPIGISQAAKISNRLERNSKWQGWKLPTPKNEELTGNSCEVFKRILSAFQKKYYPKATCIVYKQNKLIHLLDSEIDKKDIYWLSLVRNPFAIYASQKTTISPATNKVMSNNPLAFSDQWNTYTALINRHDANRQHHIVFYEQLLNDLDDTMQKFGKYLAPGNNWNKVKNLNGKVAEWLHESYLEMHEGIDGSPQEKSLVKWESILTHNEVAVLSSFCRSFKNYCFDKEPLSESKLYLFRMRISRRLAYWRNTIRNTLRLYA